MEEIFREVADPVASIIEVAAVLIIALGVLQALYALGRYGYGIRHNRGRGVRKEVWLSLAMWLLLGLEFELAADIVRSVITPTWMEIGKLGAIEAIRTFLNLFLEKDLNTYHHPEALS